MIGIMATNFSMHELQEGIYGDADAYRDSPHLKHSSISQTLLLNLRSALTDVRIRNLPPTLLEVGAGAGGFVEPALAYGCTVAATDMARPALEMLTERYGENPNFTGIYDPDGTLAALGDRRFSLALYASVLHHIPDYMKAIELTLAHLEYGGAFLSFQDPLWYPSMKRSVRLFSETAYLAWRVTQSGNYVRGFKSRLRRARGALNTSNPSDMVEYHVVRNGVNHTQIATAFASRFDRFSVLEYWSTQGRGGQRVGEALGVKNTFALVGTGYRG